MTGTGLSAWLGNRTAEQLADLLVARPDVRYAPPPATMGELAERLSRTAGVRQALYHLDRPALQVVEVLQVLGDHATRAGLAAFLGVPVSHSTLVAALRRLQDFALGWPDGEDRLRLAGPLRHLDPAPLLLGEPVAALLANRPVDALRTIAGNLAVRPPRRKQDLVAAAAAGLSDHEAVRALLAQAPAQTRKLVTEMAWHGPILTAATGDNYHLPRPYDRFIRWALDRGLLVEVEWATMMLPREVALAVRGPDYHAPFDPEPPAVIVVDDDPAAVAGEAAGAAGRALGQVTALLDQVSSRPVALLRSGGVGVRELRRLAVVIGADAPTARLWLEVASAAGLLAPGDGGLLVTETYDQWRATEPADQLVPLVSAWWELAGIPLYTAGLEPPPPALIGVVDPSLALRLRRGLLGCAAELAPGRVADPATLVARVGWRRPRCHDDLDDAAGCVSATWREAEALGVVALGRLTEWGHAVLAADIDGMGTAARAMLPAAEDSAVFQADLTAVVRGAPSARLTALLDLVADRESRDSASTWRFSTGSVRRALDTGETADSVLDALAEVAAGDVPQPLTYLITDVARRHGTVRVTPVACCVRADDPVLVAEIAAARGLRKLKLRVLAPTVLASAKPVAETLQLLRDSGYAPVGETADGAPRLERTSRRRATPSHWAARRRAGRTAEAVDIDPQQLAQRLLAAPRRSANAMALTGTVRVVRDAAAQLPISDVRLLAHAIDNHHLVRIDYRNADGRPSTRVVGELDLDPPYLGAYCHLRNDDRVFLLSRVESVSPV